MVASAGDPPPSEAVYPGTPFERLGGTDAVLALAERFYDVMEQREPELARVHPLDANGRITPETRERFGLFLVGWLGGPQTYMARHGHPRLRMRHAHVAIGESLRDAWLRCMDRALAGSDTDAETRAALSLRFAEVADFLRNHVETGPVPR